MNGLNGRLKRLERRQPDAGGAFVGGWELLAGYRRLVADWLAERGYTSLVDAVAGGENAPLLIALALEEWMADRHYVDALEAVEGGGPVPPGLEPALRERAECDRKHRAFACREKTLVAGELWNHAGVHAVE
jgi:hypothetical protein